MSSNHQGVAAKAADGRVRVLEAAWALVAESGAVDVTLSQIAKRAGVSRQAIYLFFGNRAGLLVEMTRHRDAKSGISRRFLRAIHERTATRALEQAVRTWFLYIPEIYPVALALAAAATSDAEAAAAWKDRMDAMHKLSLNLATRLDTEGMLASGWTAARAADYIYAQAHFTTWYHLVIERGWPPDMAVDHVVAGLKAALLR